MYFGRTLKCLLCMSVFAVMSFMCMTTAAFNLRQATNSDGLSSSAILTMTQDNSGSLWIGTLDGVNICDGQSIIPFSMVYPGLSLSGNLIETIVCANDDVVWINTNHGLDRLDKKNVSIKSFKQFGGQEHLCVDKEGNLYVVGIHNSIYCYFENNPDGEFVKFTLPDLNGRNVRSAVVIDDRLILFTKDGVKSYQITKDHNGRIGLSAKTVRSSKQPVKCAYYSFDKDLITITDDHKVYLKKGNEAPQFITDISSEVRKRGDVSDVVKDINDNIYISFAADGVLKLHKTQTNEYVFEDLGIHAGVFCLEKSKYQPVVWIGSDCQGLFTCYESPYTVRPFYFSSIGKELSHPIRAIYYDKQENLWLGTKGGGIVRFKDFNKDTKLETLNSLDNFTVNNSGLIDNYVYAFANSSRPIIWIASEGGLSYFSYTDNSIHKVATDSVVRHIHSIYEENDSTLWLTTLGNGVIRCKISPSTRSPEVSVIKSYTLDNGNISSNYFFSMTSDPHGGLLFANRGMGAYILHQDSLVNVTLKNKYDSNAVNDVFAIVSDGAVKWLGTGHGLLKVSENDDKLFLGIQNGFLNNTIHDILKDDEGYIWITTNNGLYRLDPNTELIQSFGRKEGVNINEFSDGAAFKANSMLIFGGTDGFVTISKASGSPYSGTRTFPLVFQQLSVLGENVLLNKYVIKSKDNSKLVLRHNENRFSVTFSIPDFLNPSSYHYLYTLDGKEWIDNGNNGTISFNEMKPGTYKMQVKYSNWLTGEEGEPYVLNIEIKAPWYLSDVAKVCYTLLALCCIGFAALLYIWRQRSRRAKDIELMQQAHKENVYEEKLKFFTNITHEFCTPLTLIYGPCERISTYEGTDSYIKKYINIVKTNVERLNTLIQELIDFRRIETGHEILKIRTVNLSELCTAHASAFSDLAERNNIEYSYNIEPDILWNTDFSAIRKILSNLVSNAFKYTSHGGKIEVDVYTKNNRVIMSVYNTGKGISDDDKQHVFNRYSVLDNVEENAFKGTARNGLGMAICYSMVKMLNGNIEIESTVGEYARFVVELPPLKVDSNNEPLVISKTLNEPIYNESIYNVEDVNVAVEDFTTSDEKKQYDILIIDDNKDILLLLKDSLNAYNVLAAESAEEGLELIKKSSPDLIITDIMMPGTDGLSFAHQIKANRHTMHIPIIILSAKTSEKEKKEGIMSGADFYITKPFSVSYLTAVVNRLIESRNTLKEYYKTSASAYEYSDGKLIDKEGKEFLDKASEFVLAHIEDNDMSPELLADAMNISIRKLYRRFKELQQPTPNDFIKNIRINHAAKLLVTTSDTIQEIIFMTGFTNRSHFYREFDKRYGMTPKEYRDKNKKADKPLNLSD